MPDYKPSHSRPPQQPIGHLGTVGDFWQWAMSDLLNNANRGLLAEFLVGKLLGLSLDEPRVEWNAYDLLYRGHKVEVKSSAYIQSWHDENAKRSTPSFSIGKRLGWDSAANTIAQSPQRSAVLYVFTLFPRDAAMTRAEAEQAITDPEQWAFYVLRADQLPDQDSIRLKPLEALCGPPLPAQTLKARVDALLDSL